MNRSSDSFKIGFLRGLAQNGLLPSDVEAFMEKAAVDASPRSWVGKLLSTGVVGGGNLLYRVGLGVPLLGGAAAGAVARIAAQADDEDVDEYQKREMRNVYRQLTDEIRERMANARRTRR